MQKTNIYTIGILRYIFEHNGQTILIEDIMNALATSRPTVSRHLNRLIQDGAVIRKGKKYFAAKPPETT